MQERLMQIFAKRGEQGTTPRPGHQSPHQGMLEQKLTSAFAIERLREELKTERPIAMMSPAQNQHSGCAGKKANASMIWRLNEQIKMP